MTLDNWRDEENLERLAAAVRQVRSGDFTAIRIDCYNEEEARWFQAKAAELYPGIPIRTTWLTFGEKVAP